jgi:signal transduction histidine kinase
MREQAELISARLDVATGPGRGTRVTIEMPV